MAKVTTSLFGDVAVLPFPSAAPMVERLMWLTEVFNSFNGTEERNQLRSAPRQQLQYTFGEQAWGKVQEGYNTERGALRELWAVPLWSQGQSVGALAAAATTIACTTDIYDLREDQLAMVYQSPDLYELVQVTAVDVGSIDCSGLANTYTAAYLFPVRTGYVAGDVVRRSNGHNTLTQVTYELEDNLEIASSAPTQFLSQDLYTDETLMDGVRYEGHFFSPEDRADYELGVVSRSAPWTYNRRMANHSVLLTTPAEVYAFRQFLARRGGKYRAFWQPTFENNLRKKGTGTIVSQFRFHKDSYQDWATDQVHAAFQDLDGTWYPRTLSALSTIDSTTLEVTLSSALNLPYSSIKCVSFLGSMRLTGDVVEMNWIGNNVCKVPLGVTELAP